MGRAAVLFVGALCGCSSVFGAPGISGPQVDTEARAPAPERALTEAELRALIGERLGELASALEPLCGPDCRSLRARADPELERFTALRVGQSRTESVLLYRPDEFQRTLSYSESLAMYGLAHEMGHYVDIAIAGSELDDLWRLEMAADAVAGCAFVTLRLRLELVRAVMSATAAPEDSIDSRLDLVCGSDREHPAIRWELEAFKIGARLCQSRVVPLERLETEVAELAAEAKHAAERARARFPAHTDPCRWRRFGDDSLHRKAYWK